MQKPEIGDTLVCRNGMRYICCSSDDLSDTQKPWADVYITEHGGYLGKQEGDSEWMHWTESLRSRTSNPEWDIVEIRSNKPKFNPKPGDTIVTAKCGKYTCVARKDAYYGNADFYGESVTGSWSSWMCDGRTETEALASTRYHRSILDDFRVVEIIPAAVQAQESTLEFRIRVLEKENQMLTRLLLKEGKL